MYVAGKGILTVHSLTHSSPHIQSHPHSSSLLHTLTPLHPSSSTQVDLMKQCNKYLHKITDLHHNQVHTCVHVSLNMNKTTTLTPTWPLEPSLAQSYIMCGWAVCVHAGCCTTRERKRAQKRWKALKCKPSAQLHCLLQQTAQMMQTLLV